MNKPKTAQLGLVFDFNALTELDDKQGLNLFDKKSMNRTELSPSMVRKLVWAGLLHKKSDITLEEAGKKVTLENLNGVIDEIQQAITKAFSK